MNPLPPLLLGQAQAVGLPEWALPTVGGILVVGLLLVSRSFFVRRPVRVAEKPKVTFQREDAGQHGLGEERRRWPRRGGNPTPVVLQDVRGGLPWPGTVIDRSAGGLCLQVDRELESGMRLTVRPAQAPEHIPAVAIQTVHVRSVGEQWQVGCQFLEPPPLNVLLFFG